MKWKEVKDKGFKVLFGIYIFIFAADLISTLINGELVQYLEANPLQKVGGLPLIILINILFAWFYYWVYKKGNKDARFFAIFTLVAVILVRIIAIKNNILIYMNPPTLEQAIAVTQAVKTEYVKQLMFVNIFPFFNGIIAWLFFRIDHNIKKKGD